MFNGDDVIWTRKIKLGHEVITTPKDLELMLPSLAASLRRPTGVALSIPGLRVLRVVSLLAVGVSLRDAVLHCAVTCLSLIPWGAAPATRQ